MTFLIILSLASFLGAAFLLMKKIYEMAPHVETTIHDVHTNFILDFLQMLQEEIKNILREVYLFLRPYAHDLVSSIASMMYKMSAWLAGEFLKFYNFIQGRKVLKNSGNTSMFIRDITKDKEYNRARRGA